MRLSHKWDLTLGKASKFVLQNISRVLIYISFVCSKLIMYIKWNILANLELKPIGNQAINSYQTMIGYITVTFQIGEEKSIILGRFCFPLNINEILSKKGIFTS